MKQYRPAIVERNFLRLLRMGAFASTERIEPMSEWKWQKLYSLSNRHGVTPWVADGIRRGESDFFMTMSPSLRQQFYDDTTDRIEEFSSLQLTNPLLNRKLQKWGEEVGHDNYTFELLLNIVAIARNIIKQGINLRQLIILGTYLHNTHDPIDYSLLRQWIAELGMNRMASLEASLLILLFHFNADKIQFTEQLDDKHASQLLADFFLSQRSVSRLRYFPRESFLNFAAEMFKAVKDIEE